jgi:hypothetical protein
MRQSLAASAIIIYSFAAAHGQSTNIAIGPTLLQPSVKRFGMNITNQDYYDAGQMTKNLVSRNPGFEGEIYQSTIRCASGTASSCVDDDQWSAWPNGFWNGATFEVFFGASQGRTGTISAYTAAGGGSGGTFTFSNNGAAPATGDYMIVRMTVPGNAAAGWWPSTSGNGSITTNTSDLPPGTTGLQTAAVKAPAASDSAGLAAYFDGDAGRSFVLLNGTYQLSFKAKGTGGSNAIALGLQRGGLATYLNQTVNLSNTWTTYSFSFNASESGSTLNSVALSFNTVGQDSFLLDDVSLTQSNSDPTNITAFRDPMVSTLQTLNPGVLRFWAGQLGDTLDNLIAPQYARQRAGYSAFYTSQNDISFGLQEFLQLCESIGAEPWFVVPSTFSTTDASHLIEYLAGSSSTPYGAKRAANGHPNPWIGSFPKIHLEFGNEAWNSAFKGGSIEYSAPYGQRAQAIFGAMRANAAYSASSFDLVLGGQAVWMGRNQDIQNNCNNNDSFTVAPYMMGTVNSFSSNEDLFGSTFAEAEALISSQGTAEGVAGGMMTLNQQAIQATSHPVPVVMYEMNMSTLQGSITQAALNSYVSSLGAGLAVVDAMLQEMRQGVLTQNLWNLTQYNFVRPDGKTAYLWGAVVDMGVTNQRRPQFLALQLANQAIGANAAMIQTVHTGADPTWNQALVNTVQLPGAHYLQSFAFSNGSQNSLVVFNLHRTATLPVTFSGANAPSGSVQRTLLTSANLTDTNESAIVVAPVTSTTANFNPSTALSLPPYSMTVLTWTGGSSITTPPVATPPVTAAPQITSVAVSSLTGTTATITWTTDQTSTSQVAYGTTSAYGSLSASNPSLVTAHSVSLSGLTQGTTYNFAVSSANSAGQLSTSANFTLSTPVISGITQVGGGHNNTGANVAPTSLSINYSSSSGNTIVAVCALGNTLSSISSITDGGSTWALRAFASSGTSVRSEIWSTPAGGSVASSSFTINMAGGTPASCALEEYSGVLALGNTAFNQATSGTWSVTLATQDPNNYVVAGIGANSFYGYSNPFGTIEQSGGITGNPGSNFVEMSLLDNTAATASAVSNGVITSPAPWAAVALELRSVGSAAPAAPVISAVTSNGITVTSATITWNTDQPSSSQVTYGTTTGYGSSSANISTLTTAHSVNLTGLTSGTTYNFAVLSANAGGKLTTSPNFTFSTPAGALTITSVTSAAITSTSATVTWITNQPSSSQVEYGTSAAYGSLSALNSSLVTSHSVTLTGLIPGTAYNYAALSSNTGGAITSANFTFSTAATVPSGSAPIVQNVSSWGVSGSSITMAWSTDQFSTTSVQYGTTPALGQTSPIQTALTQSHGLTLTGLSDGTTYYYRAQSTNATNVTGYSTVYSFTTLTKTPPVISNIQVTPAANHTATISWSLSKLATSQIQYGTSPSYGFWSTATIPMQNPSVTLGYVPSGIIHYHIISTDPAGNQAVSPDATFIEP